LSTTIGYDTPVTIALQALDEGLPNPPLSLDYVITSLVNQGVLAEPDGTEITDVPYTLASSGNEVVYTPKLGCGVSAIFRYVADDGGVAPSGGASNEATVTVEVLPYVANMDSDPGWTFEGDWIFDTDKANYLCDRKFENCNGMVSISMHHHDISIDISVMYSWVGERNV
ncbi:hypothetical protein LCGC14_2812060, partial [marine sediment metagenome]